MNSVTRPELRLLLGLILCLGLILANDVPATAGAVIALAMPPATAAEQVRATLLTAQLSLLTDSAATVSSVHEAASVYEASLAPTLSVVAPEAHQRILASFAAMQESAATADSASFAIDRVGVWSAVLAGAVQVVEAALRNDDAATARVWLGVREFRTATRYSSPSADATLAVERFSTGEIPAAEAVLSVRADLLDTYQARLGETLRSLPEAERRGFSVRRAELAALAEGYFGILAPSYAEQRGEAALTTARNSFAALRSGENLPGALESVNAALDGFRAAPLSPAGRARRAGQLLRFIYLTPIEYGRGVRDGRVIHDFEIQEAITFHQAAYAAFADLRDLLPPETVSQSGVLFDRLGVYLAEASQGASVAASSDVEGAARELTVLLKAAMPEAWLATSAQGDFDVIAAMLDQIESAVRNGEYELAESARLEAYAIMETGPEARLLVLAPQLTPDIESLFWNGRGEQKGLAHLIKNHASLKEMQASRARLDILLAEAEQVLGQESSPMAIATNAGIIVFREGMEAVVILASLMSSMRRAEERKYRKPMWLGAFSAFAATLATWMLAREVLQSLARYGEKLEAVVSLIAVAVLLVIMNWFFHKVYWTSWMAQFHTRKRQLMSGEAGLMLGLVILGFSSVYREGFEVVLFLQALVLEAGSAVVLAGTAVGLLFVVLLGIITFRLQVKLPYRNMLIITGIMIGVVLLQIVGKTVYSLQVVGWLPIHTIQNVTIPYWWGTWFGIYPTWEGLFLQFLAGGFVISSYFLAERQQKVKRRKTASIAA